ncbi:MAG TPA: hypothetical protein VHP35_06285, partial [Terriglobia bacterium]|nr:hypothetical protein [Terriglobia bacterium]
MTLDRMDPCVRQRVCGLLGCSAILLLFSTELLGQVQCNPKPAVYSLLEVIPESIPAGSGNTTVTLRLQYNNPDPNDPPIDSLNPSGLVVNWQGLQNATLTLIGTGGSPVNGVFSLTFRAPSTFMTAAQQVFLSVIGTFCGETLVGTSNSKPLTIASTPPPAIASVSPAKAFAGSPSFTMTLTGSGFTSNSKVRWNTSERSTNFVSSSQVSATILAQDVARTGTAGIDVVNGASGGQSNGVTIDIVNPVPSISNIS